MPTTTNSSSPSKESPSNKTTQFVPSHQTEGVLAVSSILFDNGFGIVNELNFVKS